MLQALRISNYAIIDELTIHFTEHFNIITGETGAGKSILLGALSLILGQRADTMVLHRKDKKCVVEGTFAITESLKPLFEKEDLDFETPCIIRREISASGKSRAFVNDTPVTLKVLQQITGRLVDVHAQHETLELAENEFQEMVLDALAENKTFLEQYAGLFTSFRKKQISLQKLEEQLANQEKEQDYIQFQLTELEEANLKQEDEQETLEQELESLEHAESIQIALAAAIAGLENSDTSILDQLNSITASLESAGRHQAEVRQLAERLESSRIELQDIADELNRVQDVVINDPQRIEEINERLSLFYKLEKKHLVQSLSELIEVRNVLQQQVTRTEGLGEEIAALKKELASLEQEVQSLAEAISARRKEAAVELQKEIKKLLPQVGMPNANLEVSIKPRAALSSTGMDDVQYLFSANAGAPALDIKKVASGGELSRLMLVIKSLVAGSVALPTLIFDEIDAGISGEVGQKVGVILEELAQRHQVITITHLPQIASRGDRHFFVYKQVKENQTFTHVRDLNPDERVLEIAKMLSGEKPSEAAVANARELLKQ